MSVSDPPLELMPTELLKDGWVAQDAVYPEGWWLERYWNSTEGRQRDAIIRAMEQLPDFTSVLEVGCNAGPNLRRVHRRWPLAELAGMDIHAGAIRYGRAMARAEGWAWTGYAGDLRELGLLGDGIADIVLTCYALAYLDPRDIDAVLRAALACAKRALIICEPGTGEEEAYLPPGERNVAEYHFNYPMRLVRLPGPHSAIRTAPITPPEGRLTRVVTLLK